MIRPRLLLCGWPSRQRTCCRRSSAIGSRATSKRGHRTRRSRPLCDGPHDAASLRRYVVQIERLVRCDRRPFAWTTLDTASLAIHAARAVGHTAPAAQATASWRSRGCRHMDGALEQSLFSQPESVLCRQPADCLCRAELTLATNANDYPQIKSEAGVSLRFRRMAFIYLTDF
jgi:hypothetical protein